MTDQVRLGILGAARIAPSAVIGPARKLPQVTIAAVAARNPQRAKAFADKHHIPRVFASYDELVADPDLESLRPKRVAILELTMTDGARLRERVENVRGTPEIQ